MPDDSSDDSRTSAPDLTIIPSAAIYACAYDAGMARLAPHPEAAPNDPPGLAAVIATDTLPDHGLGGPGAGGENPAMSAIVMAGQTTTLMVGNPVPPDNGAPPPQPPPPPTTPTPVPTPTPTHLHPTTPPQQPRPPATPPHTHPLPGMAHPPTMPPAACATGLDRHGATTRIEHRTRSPWP